MKFLILINFFFLFISCQKKTSNTNVSNDENLKYKIAWLNIKYKNGKKEEIEIYVSRSNDTIFNQYKLLNENNEIDVNSSQYYNLNLYKTKQPFKYKGRISFYSKLSNYRKKNHKAKESLEFFYFQETKDSVFVTTILSENKNEIDFELTNINGSELVGFLIHRIDIDTIINKEKMVRIKQIYSAVDNKISTNNTFVSSFKLDKDNKYTANGIKFEIEK